MSHESIPAESLVRQVDALRDDLAWLRQQVAEVRSTMAATADLAGAISNLNARVEELARNLDPAQHPGLARPALSSWIDAAADQAPTILVQLAGWMSTVLWHHRPLGALQPCWYRHPGVVQALLDAEAAWSAAYREPGGQLTTALDWSQRHLPHLELRVRDLLGRCSTIRHEPADGPLPVDEAALAAYARWWAQDRDAAREPAPPTPHDAGLSPRLPGPGTTGMS